VGEKYGDACDVSGSARSMSIACARVRVCAYACIHERNVDRRTIGCVNDVQCGEYLATRESPISLRRAHARDRTAQLITLMRTTRLLSVAEILDDHAPIMRR